MTVKSHHALYPPTSYPIKDGSHGEIECLNSLTLDATRINDLSYYQKLGASIPDSAESDLKKRTDKYQTI